MPRRSSKLNRLLWFFVAGWVLTLAPERAGADSSLSKAGSEPPPRTPRGLPTCKEPMAVPPWRPELGETVAYDLEILNVGVGTLSVAAARRGLHHGEPVTEIRSDLDVNRSVAALVPLEGEMATLVPDTRHTPVQTAQRYRWAMVRSSETTTYSTDGRAVNSRRTTEDGQVDKQRSFHAPVHDFLSGFYMLRGLPADAAGCLLFFGNSKPYTVWIEREGQESIGTAIGKRKADRYLVRYASDEGNAVKTARVWVSHDAARLPLRALALNKYSPKIELKKYVPGKSG
jgi:hypothetical protein